MWEDGIIIISVNLIRHIRVLALYVSTFAFKSQKDKVTK